MGRAIHPSPHPLSPLGRGAFCDTLRRGEGLPALGHIERPLQTLAQIFQAVAERVGVPAFDVGPQAPSRAAPDQGLMDGAFQARGMRLREGA